MSNTKMYVGNLPFNATENDVRDLFSEYGPVADVAMVLDRETGRPRGFAFVTMTEPAHMEAAIGGLDGKEFLGRNLTVNEARPREERPSYGGGGGGGGYGGGGGGGGYKRGGGGGGGGGGHRGKGGRQGDRW
jgi:RNA recognition motif-containing protein